MRRLKPSTLIAIAIVAILVLAAILIFSFASRNLNLAAFTSDASIADVDLPSGFQMDVYYEGLDDPRFIAFSPNGDLMVAERGTGRILKLTDSDLDGNADKRQVFRAELDRPHSLTLFEGDWYVGVPNGVIRLVDADQNGQAERAVPVVYDIPDTGQHSTRTVEFLPDGRMVLSVGSSCNACIEEDPRRAAILIYEYATGDGGSILASGLRNAVGLVVQPGSGALWATNNARDLMGDDLPPDTLHVITENTNYGWPACHAGEIPDPDLGDEHACQDVPTPALKIQAHSAPLGLIFYDGQSFPERYRGGLFIAYHGSWNRTIPTGYKVVFVPFEDGFPTGDVEDFATGWIDPETFDVSGRPVGLAVGPDGALYVSDDKAGAIYRFQYQP